MRKNITSEDSDIYEYASLSKYSFRKRLLIRLADLSLYFLILLIGKTIRFEPLSGWKDLDLEGFETFEKARENNHTGSFVFWHECIFLNTYYWRADDAAIMVSRSFDGEYLSRCAQRFGFGVIRGSSSKGGASALAKMISLTKRGTQMGFAVDGPRGPRRKVKKGVIVMSRRTGLPIAPIVAEAKHRWILNSWDKTQIPKPFTRAKIFVGEPVFVPTDADPGIIEEKRLELEQKLDELVLGF